MKACFVDAVGTLATPWVSSALAVVMLCCYFASGEDCRILAFNRGLGGLFGFVGGFGFVFSV